MAVPFNRPADDQPRTRQQWARYYRTRGWCPLPLPTGEKNPSSNGTGWHTREYDDDCFKGDGNIGNILKGNTLDVDLDAPEAVAVAPSFLPPTHLIHGRASKPRSHWWYTGQGEMPGGVQQYKDPLDGAMLVELRATDSKKGAMTVVPPSIHPEGEDLVWYENGEPGVVDVAELHRQVKVVASISLLARHWPGEGSRHACSLALAGYLLQGGLDEALVADIVCYAALTAGDDEAEGRRNDVRTTAERLARNETVNGFAALKDILDIKLVRKLEEWLGLKKSAEHKSRMPAEGEGPYSIEEAGIFMRKLNRGSGAWDSVQLTNFKARIIGDVVKDDGVETQRAMELEAALAGRTPVRFTVPAAQFTNLGWAIEHLGAKAVVFPGYDAQSNARAAIQLLSEDIATRHVYTHLGWRKLPSGAWVYLHTEGGVGADWSGWSGSSEKWSGQNSQTDHGISGNQADSSSKWSGWSGNIDGETSVHVHIVGLPHYTLPSTCGSREELRDAVQASLRMLDVAALRLTVPVYAAIWRAALGNCDFSLHISGKSGAGKSALAALAVQHYGRGMDARHLPGNWSSTDNALGGLQFVAKDALLVVDEFKPIGTAQDIARWHAKADRVLRAQGNGSGRQRMRADATLREEKPPRCLTLSTGEDNPRGDSLQARMLILAMSKEDMDWTRLTAAQQDASSGQYALAMAGYLSWIAPQYEDIRAGLEHEKADLRDRIVGKGQHQRTPEIVANLFVGLRYFLKFAIEVGALSEDEAKGLWIKCHKYLAQASAVHAAQQANELPTRRFAELLQSALLSGKAHVASAVDGKKPEQDALAWGWGDSYPHGGCIGWVDGDNLYLEPTTAHTLASTIAQQGNEAFPLTHRMLSQHLQDEKLLLSQEPARESRSVRKMIAGNRVAVLHLHTSYLLSPVLEPDQPDQKVA